MYFQIFVLRCILFKWYVNRYHMYNKFVANTGKYWERREANGSFVSVASRISCKVTASGSCQNEIRQCSRPKRSGSAHVTRDDRCDRLSSAPIARENIRKYSTCKFIEILRTPALRREMYSRRSGDTRTKSASLYRHSAPFESIA